MSERASVHNVVCCDRVDGPGSVAWMADRACVDVPVEVFFAEDRHGRATARAICAACPVASDCLQYALENREEHGIWGGRTPTERRRFQKPPRVRPVPRCGTDSGYMAHRRLGELPCDPCKDAHSIAGRLRKHRLAVVR